MPIIDIHTHAFPDAMAPRAIQYLEEEGDIKAVLDGTTGALLNSMDRAGIAASVVASIATRPEMFASIFRWSGEIASERLIPFPSIYPSAREAMDQVREVAAAGFRGIKLHPYYQRFVIDDPALRPFWAAIEETGLLVLLHTGYDLAFPREPRANPRQVAQLLEDFPGLRLITTHVFAWEDWDEAEEHLAGKPVHTDVSMSIESMPREQVRRLLLMHPPEYLLFGTDSPWIDQAGHVALVRALDLGAAREEQILYANAAALLGIG